MADQATPAAAPAAGGYISPAEAKYDLSAQPKPLMLKGNLEHKEPKKDKKTGDSKKPCSGPDQKKKVFKLKAEEKNPGDKLKPMTPKADPGKGPLKGDVDKQKPGGPLQGGANQNHPGPLTTGTNATPQQPSGKYTPMDPQTAPATPPGKPPDKPPLQGTLTKDEARDRFKELAGKKDSIPFDYPDDCCFSRAHEMCRLLEAQGITTDKIWLFDEGYYLSAMKNDPFAQEDWSLHADTPNHPSGSVAWRYHVATVVYVQGPDGAPQPMVMDPSLFNRPVTPQVWAASMHNPNAIMKIGNRDSYGPTSQDPDYSKTKLELQLHAYKRDHRRVDVT